MKIMLYINSKLESEVLEHVAGEAGLVFSELPPDPATNLPAFRLDTIPLYLRPYVGNGRVVSVFRDGNAP